LLQLLEDEKDKNSTWKEEQEDLLYRLEAAESRIQDLERENADLEKAAEETSWSECRQTLIKQTSEGQTKITELLEAAAEYQSDLLQLEQEKTRLEIENQKLREDMEGGSNWERQEISLKLSLAEKQNRLLELSAENESLIAMCNKQQSALQDAQAEIESLAKQAEAVSWAEEREALLLALDEEIDKRASWEEEKSALEQQVASMTEEISSLKTENASLSASTDEVSWAKEREELCRALEEEKEKLSSWKEETEALEEENKSLKWVFHVCKEKDMTIQDKEEAIEQLNEKLEALESAVSPL